MPWPGKISQWSNPVGSLSKCHLQISDDVGYIARMFHALTIADHHWVVVNALARQNFPMVKSGRITFQMPFTNHGGLVAGLLEQFGISDLRAVETAVGVVVKAVDVAVGAGED